MVKVKMYQANEGDAFLISFDNEEFNILVDMGFEETYKNFIKQDLIDLKSKGKNIDLLVITHIDNDHILGAINFIYENGPDMKIIDVKEVWHNSYRHLNIDSKCERLPTDELKALNDIKRQNYYSNKAEGTHDVGAKEGTTLASLLHKFNYNWNTKFNSNAVCVENGRELFFNDVKFILLSPDINKLNKLAHTWKEKLNSIFYNFVFTEDEIFDDAFELFIKSNVAENISINDISSEETIDLEKLASKNETESSVANGSSIAFIIEKKDKKVLFLADAHHKLITQQLNLLVETGYELNFEIVKVPHHGSNKNISNKLVSLIDAKKYLFSTNGKKNNHPELEAIAKIILKETSHLKELCFNYKHEKIVFLEEDDLQKKYNYAIEYLNEIIIN